MKVMVMIKTVGADEDKVEATEEAFAAMTAYNERLVKAGIMLDGVGLKPSSAGAKVIRQGGTTSVVTGPFTEAAEVIGGYWIWEVSSLEEALEWAKQCPSDRDSSVAQILEIRPYAEEEDFGEAYTPEIREREKRLEAELKARRGEN